MKGMYAVYRKEMGHYFVSPVAYVIVAVFLILAAYFFTQLLALYIQRAFEAGLEEVQIVLGKFLASITLLVIMLLPTAIGFAYMLHHSEPTAPWRVLGSEYLGVFLLGAALLAIGSFFSSVTESQLIAVILSFGANLLLWVLDFGSQTASSAWASALEYLSAFRHYDDFTRGVIDTSNVIFYLSFIFLGVFLTIRSVDSMRWRRA